jgi:hypothetical protein
VAGRLPSILICITAALLLVVLIDGWAVGFLPRLVEKLVILAAFLIVAALVVVGLMGRDGGVFFSREDARRLDD